MNEEVVLLMPSIPPKSPLRQQVCDILQTFVPFSVTTMTTTYIAIGVSWEPKYYVPQCYRHCGDSPRDLSPWHYISYKKDYQVEHFGQNWIDNHPLASLATWMYAQPILKIVLLQDIVNYIVKDYVLLNDNQKK
jgi:hypothetical protein